ncbi:peptidoglycan-binding domain-containing protein [Streptomyces sp. H51]|uniref:peptidoglycan-binding domain-containing protein n=1 Tax=Streptomyces sp. H51 TaxID=3111770 RepID=UPI002D78D85C|nr:peptidoglycan-binding protein [Streptomyces sp. H51]
MKEPNGCPECGAPRTADNTPSCPCGRQASQALREARRAEASAAEDFDPLRIRPYVDLSAPTEAPPPLPPLSYDPPADDRAPSDDEPAPEPRNRPHRGLRTVLIITAAAVTAVTTATVASGLFSYDTPSRDTALPDGIRAGVPDTETSEPPPATTRPSAPALRSPVPPPSASPSATTASPSPDTTPSAAPTPAGTPSVTATGTVQSATTTPQPPQVLRLGDQGPGVAELQLRLRRLYLYDGDVDGDFDARVEHAVRVYQWTRGITADELGVYGEETRTSLEAETTDG